MDVLRQLLQDEDGQDLIEYGLLAAFVSLAAIASIRTLGNALGTTYESFSTKLVLP